jgi:hypothetical protein
MNIDIVIMRLCELSAIFWGNVDTSFFGCQVVAGLTETLVEIEGGMFIAVAAGDG